MKSLERYTFSIESKETGGPVTFIGTATGIKHLAAIAGIDRACHWRGFDQPVIDSVPVGELQASEGDSSFVIALPRGKERKNFWYIEVPDRTIGVFDPESKKILYWHTSGNHDGLALLLASLLRDVGYHPLDVDRGFQITPVNGGRMTKFSYDDLSSLSWMVSASFNLGHEVLLGVHSSFHNAGRYIPPRLFRALVKELSTRETPDGRAIVITCGTQEEQHEFIFHSGDNPLRENMRGEIDILMY